MIKLENVQKYKKVYVITFYDGYVDGCKYSIEELDTSYTSFYVAYGTNYYRTREEARELCLVLNEDQMKKAKGE